MHPRPARALLALAIATATANPAAMAQDWVAPASDAAAVNPMPDNKKQRAAGKALYEQYCLTCHGSEGKGDGPGGQFLTPKPGDLSNPKLWTESDGALYWKIITGRNAMPSFKYFLKDDDRWQVIRYLRTFAPKPVSTTGGGATTGSVAGAAAPSLAQEHGQAVRPAAP